VTRLAELDPDAWVVDLEAGHPTFTPVRVAEFCERVLFRGIKKVILTSATLTLKTLALSGIKREDATIWECPSSFPVERRPIIHVNPQARDPRQSPDVRRRTSCSGGDGSTT
jgi:Rad3-related DNA helicase